MAGPGPGSEVDSPPAGGEAGRTMEPSVGRRDATRMRVSKPRLNVAVVSGFKRKLRNPAPTDNIRGDKLRSSTSWYIDQQPQGFPVIAFPGITALVSHGGKDSAITTHQFQRPSPRGWELLHSSVVHDSVYRLGSRVSITLSSVGLTRPSRASRSLLGAIRRAAALAPGGPARLGPAAGPASNLTPAQGRIPRGLMMKQQG
jgi:hypothetical protein